MKAKDFEYANFDAILCRLTNNVCRLKGKCANCSIAQAMKRRVR